MEGFTVALGISPVSGGPIPSTGVRCRAPRAVLSVVLGIRPVIGGLIPSTNRYGALEVEGQGQVRIGVFPDGLGTVGEGRFVRAPGTELLGEDLTGDQG